MPHTAAALLALLACSRVGCAARLRRLCPCDTYLHQIIPGCALQERSEWSAEKQRLQKEVEQLHELVEYLLDQYEVPVEEGPADGEAAQPVPRIPLEMIAQTDTIDSVPIFSP